VAQKKSVTTLPRKSERLTVLPARSGSEKAGAGFGGVYGCTCTLAKSGGAAAHGAMEAEATSATVKTATGTSDLMSAEYPMTPARSYFRHRSARTTRSGVIG